MGILKKMVKAKKPKKVSFPQKSIAVKKETSSVTEKFNLLMRGNKKETKTTYVSAINHFLRFAKNKIMDEWCIREFLEHLEKKEYSRNYQRGCWYAIKKYFKAREIPWKLDKGDYPKLDKTKINKPILPKADVIRLIEIIKEIGEPEEKMFLAICSTYGVRRVEVCSLTEQDIDRKENILHIQAAKGGEERYHLIPEEIRPYIYPWNFNKEMSTTHASIIFNDIMEKAEVENERGTGWHALRRRLTTELVSTGLPAMEVYNFTRWKDRSTGMLVEYYNPDFKEVDEKIFKKHPFIEMWR